MNHEVEKLIIEHVEEYPQRRAEMRIEFDDIRSQIREGLLHPKASETVMELKQMFQEQRNRDEIRDVKMKEFTDKLEPVITALGVAGGLRRFTIWLAAFFIAWGITNGYFIKIIEQLKK